jgi:hypothetical protein
VNSGTYISGFGHAGFLLWVLVGGFFLSSTAPKPVLTSSVSLISEADFAALSPPQTAPDVQADATPQVGAPPVENPPQVDPPQDAPPPTPPDTTPPAPTPTPPRDVPAETQATPEPPAPVLPEAPDGPAQPVPQTPAPIEAPLSDTPTPAPAPRVAPSAAARPAPDAKVSDQATPEVAPDANADSVAAPTPAAAPKEAATQIVTEAETPASAAPTKSIRPMARPKRPRPAQQAAARPETKPATTTPAPKQTPAPAPTSPAKAAVSGPQMTGREKDGLRLSVQDCWNVGALSSEALATTVVVGVSMSRDGKPIPGSIRMLSFSGGTKDSARRAFGAAKRAINRWGLQQCGNTGFKLPPEKYSRWQEIEMTFDPDKKMRIK